METVTWRRKDGYLTFDNQKIDCWSQVRNELNGLRPNKKKTDGDVFFTYPGSVASMPRPFPSGTWRITGIVPHKDKAKDPYLYPYFIATNAFQMLDEWELDDSGGYVKKTGKRIKDTAYGLHFSTSYWTQGCIRIADEKDLLFMVSRIKEEIEFKRSISFMVID
jgi:hypothetical protein